MDLSRSPAAPLLREAKGTEVLIFSKLGIVSRSATNPPILYSPFVHVALTLTWCKRPVVPQLHLSLRSSQRTTL